MKTGNDLDNLTDVNISPFPSAGEHLVSTGTEWTSVPAVDVDEFDNLELRHEELNRYARRSIDALAERINRLEHLVIALDVTIVALIIALTVIQAVAR